MICSRFGVAGSSRLTYGPKRSLHIYNNCLVIYTKHVKLDLYLYSALDKKNLGPIRASSMKTMPAGPECFFKSSVGVKPRRKIFIFLIGSTLMAVMTASLTTSEVQIHSSNTALMKDHNILLA